MMGLNEAQRGNLVARSVWQWLHEQKAVKYVPWALDDPIVAARAKERQELLEMLEQVILERCKEFVR